MLGRETSLSLRENDDQRNQHIWTPWYVTRWEAGARVGGLVDHPFVCDGKTPNTKGIKVD